MFTYLDINMVNSLLIAFLSASTTFPATSIIVETRTGPRPIDTAPYISLLWLEQELLNQFDSPFIQPAGEEDGIEELVNEARCTVRITVRGSNAYNLASDIRYQLDAGSRSFDLWSILGFSGVGSVVDLSAAYGGKIQQRAHIDLSFYAAFGRRYDLAWFIAVPWIVNGSKSLFPIEE